MKLNNYILKAALVSSAVMITGVFLMGNGGFSAKNTVTENIAITFKQLQFNFVMETVSAMESGESDVSSENNSNENDTDVDTSMGGYSSDPEKGEFGGLSSVGSGDPEDANNHQANEFSGSPTNSVESTMEKDDPFAFEASEEETGFWENIGSSIGSTLSNWGLTINSAMKDMIAWASGSRKDKNQEQSRREEMAKIRGALDALNNRPVQEPNNPAYNEGYWDIRSMPTKGSTTVLDSREYKGSYLTLEASTINQTALSGQGTYASGNGGGAEWTEQDSSILRQCLAGSVTGPTNIDCASVINKYNNRIRTTKEQALQKLDSFKGKLDFEIQALNGNLNRLIEQLRTEEDREKRAQIEQQIKATRSQIDRKSQQKQDILDSVDKIQNKPVDQIQHRPIIEEDRNEASGDRW